MNKNIRIARQLVRLAKSLVALAGDEQEQACKEFPGLDGFFRKCTLYHIPDSQQKSFVGLLRKTVDSGEYINKDDWKRFTDFASDPSGLSIAYLKYLELIDFDTLQEFNRFIDEIAYRGKYALNSTSPELLKMLVHDNNGKKSLDDIRRLVAMNKSTPADLLAELAKDNDERVIVNVADNPNTPPETLAGLAKSNDRDVLMRVAHNPSSPAEVLAMLGSNDSDAIRTLAAANPNTPVDTLITLLEDKNYYVRLQAAKNPSLPKDAIQDKVLMKKALADNPNTPPETLIKLAKDHDFGVLLYVSQNRNTPAEALRILAMRMDTIPSLKSHIANNLNTPVDILIKLAEDSDDMVRQVVALQRKTPARILAKLARDSYKGVRKSVVINESTPIEVLEELCQDEDDEISRLASLYLHNRLNGI